MITPNNAKYAEHVSSNAIMNNKVLRPKGGSPMTALVGAIAGINEVGSTDEIIKLSDTLNSSNGTHTEIQDDVATNVAKSISTIINVARNVVNPKIKESLDAVNAFKESLVQGTVGALPLVQQVELDDVFKDDMFNEMIGLYNETNVVFDAQKLYEILRVLDGAFTPEECAEIVKTGSSRLDDKVSKYLGDKIESVNYLCDMINTPIEKLSMRELVLAFMSLTGLSNERIEKFSHIVTDSGDANQILSYKAIVGRRLNTLVARLVEAVKGGSLILPVGIEPVRDNVVYVLGKTYRDWVQKDGGSPEAVMGYGLAMRESNGLNSSNAEGLKAEPAKYVQELEKYHRHMDTIRITKTVENVPRVISEYLAGVVLKSDLDDNAKAALQERIIAASKKPYFGNSDLTHYLRDFVCSVYTEGDDVKTVLIEIDNILVEHPDLDYAVYVAINRVVARWIVEEMIEVGE